MVRFLRKYPVKFYRQRVVDHFVTDFYCSKAKLVIELDGGQHFQAEQKHMMQSAHGFWNCMV